MVFILQSGGVPLAKSPALSSLLLPWKLFRRGWINLPPGRPFAQGPMRIGVSRPYKAHILGCLQCSLHLEAWHKSFSHKVVLLANVTIPMFLPKKDYSSHYFDLTNWYTSLASETARRSHDMSVYTYPCQRQAVSLESTKTESKLSARKRMGTFILNILCMNPRICNECANI